MKTFIAAITAITFSTAVAACQNPGVNDQDPVDQDTVDAVSEPGFGLNNGR